MSAPLQTFGVDLHLDLPRTRVRAGLEAALRDAVCSGRLQPGLRLPSSRTLAADLGIARNTVADVYGQLIAEGWLEARQGSGTRVADRAPAVGAATVSAAEPRVGPLPYDLRPGSPDISAFPRPMWLAAMRRALNAAPAEAFGYTDPRGRPELRHALAGYLARARGVRLSPDRIVVCSGFTQGFALLCQVLLARGGRKLAVEEYGQRDHRDVIAASGMRPSLLAVDDRGAAVDSLGDAAAVLLTAAHQFPLGEPLAPERRIRVVEWAAETGGFVIEDDYDGEFRYDRQPVAAVQSLAPERVVYAGTASKSLAPALRLGWLVLPEQLVDDVVAAKARADRHSSSLDQLALAEFITSGNYDRHVRRQRLRYRRRRDRLITALRHDAPQIRITGIAAGLHALLELPAGHDEGEIVTRGARQGLALDGLGTYSAVQHRRRAALVVGYGTPPDHAFSGAVDRLVGVLGGSPDH